MRRVTSFVLAGLLGCSSGDLEDGAPATPGDARGPEVASDAAVVDDTAVVTDIAAPDSTPTCGVVACDETKTHYPRIQAAYDRNGGEARLGAPFDNGGGIFVHPWGPGRVQDFANKVTLAESDSADDWAKTGYAVGGEIRTAWLALGGGPVVGYPREDAHPGPGGTVQTFEKGCIGPDGSGGHDLFAACEEPPDLAPTISAIASRAATSTSGTDFGIAVVWLPTGKRWAHRGDVARTSASSAKWVWAMAALNKNSVATVEPPALPTFRDSNNSTAGTLIDQAGGPNAVNDFTSKTLGIPTTQLSLCRWSYDKTRAATNCSNAAGGDNFFTPNGAATFLEKVWQRAAIGRAKGDKLLDWAKLSPRSGYGGWVGTQLPSAVRATLHHKAGWLPTGCCSSGYPAHYNDLAIARTSRGAYAVVLSMKGGTDARMIRTMEWSSCVLFHALARDVADPLTACTGP